MLKGALQGKKAFSLPLQFKYKNQKLKFVENYGFFSHLKTNRNLTSKKKMSM